MKKRLLVLALVAAAGFLLLVLFAPASRITKQAFDSIECGVSEREISAILDMPGSDQLRFVKGDIYDVSRKSKEGYFPPCFWREWVGNGQGVATIFNESHEATTVVYFRYSEPWLDKIKRVLRVSP